MRRDRGIWILDDATLLGSSKIKPVSADGTWNVSPREISDRALYWQTADCYDGSWNCKVYLQNTVSDLNAAESLADQKEQYL